MPLSSQSYPVSIAKGVRNLVLGRILLKEDAKVGDTEVKVGVEFAAPWQKMNLPGSIFFFGYTNDAVVVQPASSDLKDDIEYQEDVTISGLTINAYHIPLTSGLANPYTVDAGAYIRPRVLPSYVSTLKLVEEDFTQMGAPQPEERLLPAVYVAEQSGRQRPRWGNLSWDESTRVLVRYYEAMDEDYDRQVFKDTVVAIATMIINDHTLGGTCYDSIVDVFSWGGTGGRIENRRVLVAGKDIAVDWADIGILAHRVIPYDKVTALA